jgi:4-hydroxy-tetrahydrodipicolinate synthase
MKKFEGIFTVMLTVYDHNGGVDRHAMDHVTHSLIAGGVQGLVVLGSNGECPYLIRELQEEAIEAVVKASDGAVPVIVGINERGTEEALAMARYAEDAGADGLLVALPVFYPLAEPQVTAHYESISGAVSIPVLYYNFPTHTRLSLSPAAIAELAARGLIVGAKETIFDAGEVRDLVEATGDDFCAFTGTCLNLTDMMGVGACGAICPLPNFAPEKAVALYRALVAGDEETAALLQSEIFTLGPLLASSPTPHAMLKEALRKLGHPVSTAVKPPLSPLAPGQAELVEQTLRNAGLIEG